MEDSLLRNSFLLLTKGGDLHLIIHIIVISKIAAIHGSEDQLAMQYVYTWVGDALESRRTTLSLSFTSLIGNS